MAHATLLQEWTTIRGVDDQVVVQSEDMYADLSPYGDVTAFAEISEITSGTELYYETSPTKDNQLFTAMHSSALTPSTGVTVSIFRYSTATVPLARWVRWRLVNTSSAWTITFRIWLSPNPSGSR